MTLRSWKSCQKRQKLQLFGKTFFSNAKILVGEDISAEIFYQNMAQKNCGGQRKKIAETTDENTFEFVVGKTKKDREYFFFFSW